MAEVTKLGQLVESLGIMSPSGRFQRPADPAIARPIEMQQQEIALLKAALTEVLLLVRHGPSWLPETEPRVIEADAADADPTTGVLVLRHSAGYVLDRAVEIARFSAGPATASIPSLGSWRFVAFDRNTTSIQFDDPARARQLRVVLSLYRSTTVPLPSEAAN